MVGFNSKSNNLNEINIAFAGASSGCITRALCQPMDVLKIRFQLQVEPISQLSVSKYRSMIQALVTISHEEGIKSLWKGHVPAQWLSITYGLVQFWCFEVTSKRIGAYSSYKPLSDFYCGALSGTLATLVSFPFDVVRTRLVAQNELFKTYTGVFNTLYSISKNEGYLKLYRGLFPTLLQVAPHAGVQFMTYKLFESIYHKTVSHSIQKRHEVFASSVICGSLAGLCSKVAIYPLDLTKKRMQIQGFDRKVFGKNFVCTSFTDCLRRTYEVEGIRGLYKGLSPSLIKAVSATALHFSSYELICHEMAKYK